MFMYVNSKQLTILYQLAHGMKAQTIESNTSYIVA